MPVTRSSGAPDADRGPPAGSGGPQPRRRPDGAVSEDGAVPPTSSCCEGGKNRFPPNDLHFSSEALLRPPPTNPRHDTRRRPKRPGPRLLQMRVRPASVRKIFETRPLASPQVRPRRYDPREEFGMMLQAVIQPVILGLESDQDPCRPPVPGDQDPPLGRAGERGEKLTLALRRGPSPGPAPRARGATLRLGPSR